MTISYECCYECKPPKRHSGCYDICPDYKEIHDANMALKEKRNQQRKIDNYTVETCIERSKRWKK